MIEKNAESTAFAVTATYAYDAIGRRGSKKVNGATTKHRWDGSNIVGDSGTGSATYYRGIDLIAQNKSNVVNYYVHDGHGNITTLTNAEGTTVGKQDYGAYGKVTTLGGEMNTVFNYCGEYQDAESGMVYLRNRYYSITMCRFTQEDPAKDGLNWYAYCGNDPVNFADPWGLDYYIFYGKDQKDSAESTRQQLLENDPNTPVVMIYVENENDFYNGWNSMGVDENENEVTIDSVIIHMHGEYDYIKVDNGEKVYVNNLKKQKIGTFLLTACSTGDMNYTENVASQFAMTQNVKQVIAPDGLGYFSNSDVVKSEYFADHGDDKGNDIVDREGNGFVLYQNIGGNLVITPGLTKNNQNVYTYNLLSRGKMVGSIISGLNEYGFDIQSNFIQSIIASTIELYNERR